MMESAELSTAPAAESVFRDGLGERRRRVEPSGSADVLAVRAELAGVPSFEFALRERASRLASFHHPSFARVRGIERSPQPPQQLLIVSDETPGVRLSVLLAQAESRGLALETNAALCLLRQLVTAIAALHETARDAAHGAIGLDRLIVTPAGRLVVSEYVLGSALEQLLLSRDRYWTDLRVALPRMAGLPRFDHLTDITEVGVVGLSLFLRRALKDDEYPTRVADVVASAPSISARGADALPAPLRSWLERALQLDPRQSFPSAIEARIALEKAIPESGYDASPASLEQFTARYHGVERPVSVAPAPTPRPAPEPSVLVPKPVSVASAPIPASPPIPALIQASIAEPVMTKPAASERSLTFGATNVDDALEPAAPGRSRTWLMAAAVVGAMVIAGGTIGAMRFMKPPAPKVAADGTLMVATEPPGARVVIDGKARGTTPLSVKLPAGSHKMELHGSTGSRTVPVQITAGGQASQYVDLPKAVSSVGQIRIRTEPAGARVTLDGTPRGAAPTLIANLTPGEHSLQVDTDQGSATQMVTVEAGTTASVLLTVTPAAESPASAASASGWIAVTGKLPVQIFEKGELVGTSDTSRIMLTTGRHELELVNESLGYHSPRAVQVSAGKVSTIVVEPPSGNLALNAQPWAEVWIDGNKVGDTPIGNFALPIGSHEVVFKHPDLGEQKVTAIVGLKEQARVSADLRKR
jgi:hypothetical protein